MTVNITTRLARVGALALAGVSLLAVTAAEAKEITIWCWDPNFNVAIMKEAGETKWLDLSDRIRAVMADEMEKRGKKIYPNVDFFSASVYTTLGIDSDLFTPIFAMSRITGWTAHLFEQYANNRLIRPKAEYTGPRGLKVTPLEAR